MIKAKCHQHWKDIPKQIRFWNLDLNEKAQGIKTGCQTPGALLSKTSPTVRRAGWGIVQLTFVTLSFFYARNLYCKCNCQKRPRSWWTFSRHVTTLFPEDYCDRQWRNHQNSATNLEKLSQSRDTISWRHNAVSLWLCRVILYSSTVYHKLSKISDFAIAQRAIWTLLKRNMWSCSAAPLQEVRVCGGWWAETFKQLQIVLIRSWTLDTAR